MAIKNITWTDRSGNPRLDFSMSNEGVVTADLFERNVQGQFQPTGIRIFERDMTIETENLNALMRGIHQRTFNLSNLSTEQKNAILDSMPSRTIEIVRGFNSGSMVIHALP